MRKVILIVSLLTAILMIVGYRLYNKPHREVADEEAIAVTASQLFTEFESNEQEANKKYLDKAIEVTGIVSETLTNQAGQPVILLKSDNPMFGIQCTMENTVTNIAAESTITVKGICTGYLSDVVITSAILKPQTTTP